MSGNQLLVRLRDSNLEEHPVTTHKVIKKGFYGCKNYATLTEAVNNRPKDIKASTKDLLEKFSVLTWTVLTIRYKVNHFGSFTPQKIQFSLLPL